jgi:hypothetical protein
MTFNDTIQMRIYLANSGAAGTFLEDLDVTDFRYHGDGPPLWSGIDQNEPPSSSRLRTGTVFERGDAHSGALSAGLARPNDVTTAEEIARRVGTPRGVEVTVRWCQGPTKIPTGGQIIPHGLIGASR